MGNRKSLERMKVDVCVVGGGSGGIGAALAAARKGAKVVLIEKNAILGGTSTMAWVHNWEPSIGTQGIPEEIFQEMKKYPNSVNFPMRNTMKPKQEKKKYSKRILEYSASEPRISGTSIIFEPKDFNVAVFNLLNQSEVKILTGATFVNGKIKDNQIKEIEVITNTKSLKIEATIYIDSTADGNLCCDIGCDYDMGEDANAKYNEPNAPENAEMNLNAITLMYRITDTKEVQESYLPKKIEEGICPRPTALFPCANGDLIVNPVDMLEGTLVLEKEYNQVMEMGLECVLDNFYWLQTEKGYNTFTIAGVAPELGIRETRRFIGDYVLTENDILKGLVNQEHEDIIAINDHAVDVHGSNTELYEMPNGPYGIPYRCLLPKGVENLFIASRAASFSHRAGASCRLSRTMMILGQAAGTAAALCTEKRINPRKLDISLLQNRLKDQGVKLSI